MKTKTKIIIAVVVVAAVAGAWYYFKVYKPAQAKKAAGEGTKTVAPTPKPDLVSGPRTMQPSSELA
jgi:hypothetical protein